LTTFSPAEWDNVAMLKAYLDQGELPRRIELFPAHLASTTTPLPPLATEGGSSNKHIEMMSVDFYLQGFNQFGLGHNYRLQSANELRTGCDTV
jgi:hypothetical protein